MTLLFVLGILAASAGLVAAVRLAGHNSKKDGPKGLELKSLAPAEQGRPPALSTNQNPPLGTCPLKRDRLIPHFCELIPSTVPALEAVLQKAMRAVKTMPCAPEEIGQVELALNEALANAILHGNRSNPRKRVLVAGYCDPGPGGGLLLVVRDEGSGFELSQAPDPRAAERVYSIRGRGIFLMRHMVDEVRFLDGGREVELHKRPAPKAT